MSKTKRIFTTIIAIVMITCTLFSINVPTFAATSSSGTKTRIITVFTKSNYWVPGSESITLSQTKGTCVKEVYNPFTCKTKTSTSRQYGEWDITVKALDGSHTFKKSLTGSSIKLNLKPNKTYIITITWDTQAEFFRELNSGNYTSFPTWYVKSTWKVSKLY